MRGEGLSKVLPVKETDEISEENKHAKQIAAEQIGKAYQQFKVLQAKNYEQPVSRPPPHTTLLPPKLLSPTFLDIKP